MTLLKLRCDTHFQHTFTACGCIFKVINLVWANQRNYFENEPHEVKAENVCGNAALKTSLLFSISQLTSTSSSSTRHYARFQDSMCLVTTPSHCTDVTFTVSQKSFYDLTFTKRSNFILFCLSFSPNFVKFRKIFF